MLCRINDFKYKDVVNAGDGVRLGYVGDVELDTGAACHRHPRAPAVRPGWGGEEDMWSWEDIQALGEAIHPGRCPAVQKRPAAQG